MPCRALSSFIFAYIIRDTRGQSLSDLERLNRFPASPLCTVTWVFEGDIKLVNSGQSLPRLCFSGPQTHPTISHNPSEVYALTMGVFPEAWNVLTGMDVSKFVDRSVALDTCLENDMFSVFQDVFDMETLSDRISIFETKLEEKWSEARTYTSKVPQKLQDWMYNIISCSVTSGAGKSLRQAQRRFKSLTGQSQRDVAAYSRMEGLFSEWLKARDSENLSLAGLAAETGFSDQSHMGREVKRLIGIPPSKLNQLIETDESFWFYRLMGERY